MSRRTDPPNPPDEEVIHLYGEEVHVQVTTRQSMGRVVAYVMTGSCTLCKSSRRPSSVERSHRNIALTALRHTLETHMRQRHGMPTLEPRNVYEEPES